MQRRSGRLALIIFVAIAFALIAICGCSRGEYSHKPIHVKIQMDDINWREAGREFTRGVYQELLANEVDHDGLSTLIRLVMRDVQARDFGEVPK